MMTLLYFCLEDKEIFMLLTTEVPSKMSNMWTPPSAKAKLAHVKAADKADPSSSRTVMKTSS